MFYGHGQEQYGRFLSTINISPDDALIRIPSHRIPELPPASELATLSDADIARMSGLDEESFRFLVRAGIREWRESPSRSVINLLRNIDPNSDADRSLFPSLLEQTRAIVALSRAGILDLNRNGYVRALIGPDRNRLNVGGGTPAMTLIDDGLDRLYSATHALYLWASRNTARVNNGAIKLPKRLFRGIRTKNLNVPFDAAADAPYPVKHCRQVNSATRMLTSTPLSVLSHSPILSFTSQRSIADFFTRNEGFVIEIDPGSVEVIACWATDEALDGHDAITGKHEREWIVRIPDNLTLAASQIHNLDYVWHRSFYLDSAVPMLEHYDVAEYDLEGRSVRAFFVYKSSGNGGSIFYSVNNGFSRSRGATRKELGFDPVPSLDRPAANMKIKHQDPFLPRSNYTYPQLTEADLIPQLEADPPVP